MPLKSLSGCARKLKSNNLCRNPTNLIYYADATSMYLLQVSRQDKLNTTLHWHMDDMGRPARTRKWRTCNILHTSTILICDLVHSSLIMMAVTHNHVYGQKLQHTPKITIFTVIMIPWLSCSPKNDENVLYTVPAAGMLINIWAPSSPSSSNRKPMVALIFCPEDKIAHTHLLCFSAIQMENSLQLH